MGAPDVKPELLPVIPDEPAKDQDEPDVEEETVPLEVNSSRHS